MSHDITAYKQGIDHEQLMDVLRLDVEDNGWAERYEAYRQLTEVAHLSRGAGNPLNQVIYLALGVYDEAYLGCSGTGDELDITFDQLVTALYFLHDFESKDFFSLSRPRNNFDDLMDALCSMGMQVINAVNDHDVLPEKRFVQDCIAHLLKTGERSIKVVFG